MNEMTESLKKYVTDTVSNIVDFPNDVKINVVLSTKNIIIQIDVNKDDCGKIIGRKGRTIEAIKILTLAIKQTKFPGDARRMYVEVIEDEQSTFNYKK